MNERKRIASREKGPQRQLGPYVLHSLIAKGGMGEVYLGQHVTLHTHAALKVLRKDLSDSSDFLERFRKEAQALARVSHPNVVQVLDIRKEANITYIAMEFAPGMDLRRWLARDGRLGGELLLSVSRQLMEGIGAAHDAGVLHRDIKPDNILVDHLGSVRITDFGIADDARLQPTGTERQKFATIAYAAPEVLKGDASTKASDVFSICATIYHLATGQPPFGTTSRSSVLAAQTRGTKALGDLRGDLPPEFCSAVMLGLAQDASLRPKTANDLLHVVFASASGQSRRNPLRVAVLAGTLVLGGLTGWLAAPDSAPQQPLPEHSTDAPATTETPAPTEQGQNEGHARSRSSMTDEFATSRESASQTAFRQIQLELAPVDRALDPDIRVSMLREFAARWEGTTSAKSAAQAAEEEQVLRSRRRARSLAGEQKYTLALRVAEEGSPEAFPTPSRTPKDASVVPDYDALLYAQSGHSTGFEQSQRLDLIYRYDTLRSDSDERNAEVREASERLGLHSVEASAFQSALRTQAKEPEFRSDEANRAWNLRQSYRNNATGYLSAACDLPDWAIDLDIATRDRFAMVDEVSAKRLNALLPGTRAALLLQLRSLIIKPQDDVSLLALPKLSRIFPLKDGE